MSARKSKKNEIKLLEHEYDGIQEYDQRLPNWWLFTLYGAIVFSVAYWFFYFQTNPFDSDESRLAEAMEEVQEAQLAASLKMLNDDLLWEQSGNIAFINAGRETYMSQCVTCHGADLKGGIGFNLVDAEWVHGGKPTEIFNTVADGVTRPDGTPSGMQAWESVLGARRIAEVVAFVLSHHEEGAEQVAQPAQP